MEPTFVNTTPEQEAAYRKGAGLAETAKPQQVPSVGRILHYILNHGPSEGQHRPAIIVRIWGATPESAVQLQVFTDKDNDREECVVWRTSVKHAYAHLNEFGTWHWPEYLPAK